jgi:predicted amidohydrolase YtcJ
MEGQPPGGWIPSERLTFEQALSAYTRGAAYAGFAEDKIGSLEPGKWADFVIVDRDPPRSTRSRWRDAGARDVDRRQENLGASA